MGEGGMRSSIHQTISSSLTDPAERSGRSGALQTTTYEDDDDDDDDDPIGIRKRNFQILPTYADAGQTNFHVEFFFFSFFYYRARALGLIIARQPPAAPAIIAPTKMISISNRANFLSIF